VIIRNGNNPDRWVDAGPSEGRVAPRGIGGHLIVGARGSVDAIRSNDRAAKAVKREAAA
jgi:hypothetical protein